MITAKKVFGSYLLEKPVLEHSAALETEQEVVEFPSSCTIGSTWTSLTLVAITPYNHDTSIFKFSLPTNVPALCLPLGAYLLVRAPGCDHDGFDAVRPYTSISEDDSSRGHFEILCKRYDQWGQKESRETHFLFTRTDHSYRPAGACSNYIHKLRVGDTLEFKHSKVCLPRFDWGNAISGDASVTHVTLLAVGVGIAPFIRIIRHLLESNPVPSTPSSSYQVIQVSLLYGVRTVRDILMRPLLENWLQVHRERFHLHYCVGSRWANVHMGAKKKDEYIPPPSPEGLNNIPHASLGWIDEEKIKQHAHPPGPHTRVFVCGLPGVYDKLCGPRIESSLSSDSVLARLGYSKNMVVKM